MVVIILLILFKILFMSKLSSKSQKTSPNASSDKVSVPGVNISEILELEEIFPDIRRSLAIIMIPIIIVAQIRIALSSSKPSIIQSLPSVNTYNRLFLAKSPPLLYITAAVALRRTSVAHANDADSTGILEAFEDLSTDLSGKVVTRGGLPSALVSPEALRAYRRGLMAQTVGLMQSTPVHSPRRINGDIESVTREDYVRRG